MDIYYANGKIYQQIPPTISVVNRGFLYGDRLFETMLVYDGKIQFGHDHLERMEKAASQLSMQLPAEITSGNWIGLLAEVCSSHFKHQPVRVRLLLFRSEGGKYQPLQSSSELVMYFSEAEKPTVSSKALLKLASQTNLSASATSAYKITSVPYVLAAIEKARMGADDLVLLDTSGNLAECTMANIFWRKKNAFYTPALSTGCIAGVMRKNLINWLSQSDQYEIKEVRHGIEELHKADLVISTNISQVTLFENFESSPLKGGKPEVEELSAILHHVFTQATSHIIY